MNYQTIMMPDQSIIPGIFPTLEWFQKIKKHVRFLNQTVVDFGCNHFMLGLSALLEGASFASGIDLSADRCLEASDLIKTYNLQHKAWIQNLSCEQVDLSRGYNVAILSMIVHWLKDPVLFLNRLNDSITSDIVVIFRSSNSHYIIPNNGKWFPTVGDIDLLLTKFYRVHYETLAIQDNNKEIILAIYHKKPTLRRYVNGHMLVKYDQDQVLSIVARADNLVCKVCPTKLHAEWQEKMKLLLTTVNLPAFAGFTDLGYITHYLDGYDLHGNRPFIRELVQDPVVLPDTVRCQIIDIVTSIVQGGITHGWYLADIAIRNFIVANEHVYLIDYDEIVNYQQLVESYLPLWQSMLDYLQIPYSFNGNITELLQVLHRVR